MFTLIRIASALCVLTLRSQLPRAYLSLFFAVLFGHYALALWYSQRRLRQLLSPSAAPLGQLSLLLGCVLIPLLDLPSLVVYFGLHHALTEGYMVATRRGGGAPEDVDEGRLLVSRVALTFAGYCLLLWRDRSFMELPLQGWAAIAAACFVAFLVCLARVLARRRLRGADALDLLAFEVVGLALAAGTRWLPVTFHDVVFYHLLVWTVLPLRRLSSGAARAKFVAQVAVVTALFYCLMPAAGLVPALTLHWWLRQSQLWGYFHITTSFAIAGFNPAWVTRWFFPAPSLPGVRA